MSSYYLKTGLASAFESGAVAVLRRRLKEVLASLGVSLLLLVCFYGPILIRVHRQLFSGISDGIKNYFVVFYPVLYGNSWFQTLGMNYPFGEHLVYLDAQPVLVWALRIGSGLFSLGSWMLGFMNGAMLISAALASLVLFAILRLLGHRPWTAIPAAAGVAFLSPQLLRMLGHYGLAYLLPIPLCWLGLIWFRLRCGRASSFLIGVNTLFWSLVHTYFLGLLSLLVGGTWGLLLLRRLGGRSTPGKETQSFPISADQKPLVRLIPDLLLQLLFPLFSFLAILWISDPFFGKRGRTAADFDPTIYRSTLEGLFVPFARPLGEGLSLRVQRFGNLVEGMSYVGLVVPAILLCLLLWSLASRVRGRKPPMEKKGSQQRERIRHRILVDGLIVGGISLILATGWLWDLGSGGLWAWAGPLRQLRAIGRFSWIFYYTASIFAFSKLLTRGERAEASKKRAYQLLILLAFSIQLSEGWLEAYEIRRVWRQASVPAEYLLPETVSGIALPLLPESIESSRYQAILPLPFYHIGSDRDFRFLGNEESIPKSMALSLKTGLPLMALHAARTPDRLTRMSLSLFDRGPALSQLRNHFENRKPFLVMVVQAELSPPEKALLSRAVLLESQAGLSFYELPFEAAVN